MSGSDRAAAITAEALSVRDAGEFASAEALLRRALRADPHHLPAANALGLLLRSTGRLDRAEAIFRSALRSAPDMPLLHHHLGLVLRDRREFAAAAAAFRQAATLDPDLVEAWESLGNTLGDLGELDAAREAFAQALRREPQRVTTHYNLAMTELAAGRYADGFARYEARLPVLGIQDFDVPRWRGEALQGRTLLVHAEQGFGDTLQFCRLLRRIEGRLVLQVPRALVRLLSGLVSTVVGHDEVLPPFQCHCPMMSLPAALGLTLDDLPGPIPYLPSDPARWRERLGPFARPWVGIAYAGATHFAAFAAKAVPPQKMQRLLELPATFVSLQKDKPTGPLRPPRQGGTIVDWTGELSDFADTADLVGALDLVASIDTAAVHLAGALGIPALLMDRADPCWRWLRGREDSPWYPSVRIVRQTRVGDWDGVLARVRDAVATWPLERA